MPEFKIKKGLEKYTKVPIDKWSTDHLCMYYKDLFEKSYGIETRRPIGQLKTHINQKTVSRLFRMEGRSIDIHPTELFRQYIDWMVKRKTVKNMRVWYFSKEDIMVDFLDERAKEKIDKEIGSNDEFMKAEKQRLKEAEEYFKKNREEME